MKIKEFEALTLKDCLSQVRDELGPEAVILDTRKTKRGGVLGWGARDAVRIVAGTGIAVDESGRGPASRRSVRAATANSPDTINPGCETPARREAPDFASFLAARAIVDDSAPRPNDSAKVERLESELQEIKAALALISRGSASESPELNTELLQRLLDADVPERLANELLAEVPSGSVDGLRERMTARISVAGSLELVEGTQKVVALVGPTGVGKTTTLAKLAAQFALVERKRVGLITMDTYRIAAVEQLRSYSQIIRIPLEVVHDRKDLDQAMTRLKDCDLVLIDTAGRSQRNAMQVSELRSLVDATRCETHLVLSASTRERDLLDQVRRFAEVGVDRLVFTKLDETGSLGTLYGVAVESGVPLSYLGTGQKVPEDLEAASAESIVARIL